MNKHFDINQIKSAMRRKISSFYAIYSYKDGLMEMEFAGVDKTARSKMGVWKMQEWTNRHGMARVDNAGEIIQ